MSRIHEVELLPMPWERQEDEPLQAFRMFTFYRDLNPLERTLDRARRTAGGKMGMGKWQDASAIYRWVDRVAAWDDEQDRIKREHAQQEILRMAERQARQAEQIGAALMQPSLALLRKLQLEQERIRRVLAADPTAVDRPEGQPELLQESMATLAKLAADCARTFPQLIQVERLARGLSTEHVVNVNLSPRQRRADPIQSQDEYALDLWEAMIDAGLLPAPAGELEAADGDAPA